MTVDRSTAPVVSTSFRLSAAVAIRVSELMLWPTALLKRLSQSLTTDGRRQHPDAEPAERHRRGVEYFQSRFFQQREADGQDGDADHEARQILVPGVAVGVLFVRALAARRKPTRLTTLDEASERLFRASAMMAMEPNRVPASQLAQTEQEIAGHAHEAGQIAIGRADGGVFHIIRALDEAADQKLSHNLPAAAAATSCYSIAQHFTVLKCFCEFSSF